MAQSEAREKLERFLEEKAFRPVMRASPSSYPESKRDKLKDVQRRTESEIDRFRHYRSAEEVVTNFRRDLQSGPAKKAHRDLSDLGLPTVNDLREEFEALVRDLRVK